MVVAKAHQQRMSWANRRFNDALKTPAKARRLAMPSIMMNIADQQVNVLNGSRDGGSRRAAAATAQAVASQAPVKHL